MQGSWVTASHALTPITSTIPIQVIRTTPSCVYSRFRWNLVEGCSSYDVITSWPDLTWPFFLPKVVQKMPHKLRKISARYSKRCGVQLRKLMWGCNNPPQLTRVKWLNPICIVNINDKKIWESKGAPAAEAKSSSFLVTVLIIKMSCNIQNMQILTDSGPALTSVSVVHGILMLPSVWNAGRSYQKLM